MGGRMGFVEKGEGKLRGWVRGGKEVTRSVLTCSRIFAF
jgi:hypothetical protein